MSELHSFIQSCLIDSAAEIERAKKKGLKTIMKGRNDAATSADLAAEKLMMGRIAKEYPDAVVLSEETAMVADFDADSLFVIDPIDGTHNFIQGMPLYGVSLAHFSRGKPQAGGTYLVPQKMLFYAEQGKRATLNGRGTSVSKTERLEDFFLLCDSRLHIISEHGYLPAILELEKMSQHTRFLGSAIYDMGYIACGMADAQFHFKLKPYDFAAAAFIAEQSGATVTDFAGRKWSLSTKEFLSSNGRQHRRILGILNRK